MSEELTRRRAVAGLLIGAAATVAPLRAAAAPGSIGSKAMSSEQENAQVIREQHRLLGEGRLAEAAAQFNDPVRNHGRPVPRSRILAILEDNRHTFPDVTLPIEELVASGPNVIVRCRFRGTHRGTGKLPINGGLLIDVPPTGRTMDVQHTHWYMLEGGLIVAHWANRDDVGMMQQLGLLPETKFDFSKLAAPS